MDADELDPDDLDPPDRSAAHADSLRPGLEEDRVAEAALARQYRGIASDDVDLPPTRGRSR